MSHPQILRYSPIVKSSIWFVDSETPENEIPASDIDSSLFTHLFCAFADLNSHTHKVNIWSHQFYSFTEIVQRRNSNVQTLLSIGGPNADKSVFVSMARSATSRKSFIDSSIEAARNLGFHGLDLDWEYPSNDVEMTNYGKLMEEWRVAVKAESDRTDRLPLLLTATVFYSSVYESLHYPVQAIADNLDWVNIKAYDFYGPGSSQVTGPAAALFDPSNSSGLSGDSGLNKWLEAGLPTVKAVLGFSYCGWAWILADADNNGYDAPTTGPALSTDGAITYAEIRNYIVNHGAETMNSPLLVGDYCHDGKVWIVYDDNQTVVTKVKYAKQKGLLGYYSWHISADYNCGLSRAASRAWDSTKKTT